MNKKYKIAIIGCGNISRSHLNSISSLENAELVSVCDIKKDRADKVSDAKKVPAFYDWKEMIDKVSPDVVHILTPHHLHIPMAKYCLERGINVLSEKPCGITKESLEELEKAVNSSSASYGVCFQNRFNPGTIKAKEIIESGLLGSILGVRGSVFWKRGANYYADEWHGTKSFEGGGVLINQAIHTLDLMLYLIGREPKSIDAHLWNDHLKGVIETEDTALLRMTFEDDLTAYLTATTAFSINESIEIKFLCEKAELIICADKALYIKHSNGEYERIDIEESGNRAGENYWGGGHTALIHDFYDCLQNNRAFSVDFNQASKSAGLLCDIYDNVN